MTHTVTATFKTYQAAQTALAALEQDGFSEDEISLVATDKTTGHSFNMEEHSKAPEGASTGAAIGGLAGAILAGLAATGALVAPGIGLVAAGPVLAAFAGAGVGGLSGGIIGALVGAGIPEHEAKKYEGEIKNGAVLIAVTTDEKDRCARAKQIFEEQDAYNIAA